MAANNERNGHLLVPSPTTLIQGRQGDIAGLLVVHPLRRSYYIISSLREIYSHRAIVQGGLAGFRVFDPVVLSHGRRACHFTFWDEQF